MARPKKNNADYFSHDNNMRDDPKIKYIRSLFGLPCYAVYCMLLEYLCYSDGLKIERNDHHKKLLCGDFCISKELLDQYIDAMIDVELIILEDGHIYSGGLNHRLQGVFDKRNHSKDKFLLQKQTETPISVTESTQSKVKESKVNKIKEKNIDNGNQKFSEKECIERFGEKSKLHMPQVKEAIKGFVINRYSHKDIMSQKACELLWNKLWELAKTDADAIEMLNEAVINNWKSVYPLKKGVTQYNKNQDIAMLEFQKKKEAQRLNSGQGFSSQFR